MEGSPKEVSADVKVAVLQAAQEVLVPLIKSHLAAGGTVPKEAW